MYARVVLTTSKFISSSSPQATTTSASKPKETSVLDSKIFMKRQDKLNSSPIFSQLLDFLSLKFLLLRL